jgi:hypothetical protein
MSQPSKWDRIFQGAIAVVVLGLFAYLGFRCFESGEFDLSLIYRSPKLLLVPFIPVAMLFAVMAANRRSSESPEEESEEEFEEL